MAGTAVASTAPTGLLLPSTGLLQPPAGPLLPQLAAGGGVLLSEPDVERKK